MKSILLALILGTTAMTGTAASKPVAAIMQVSAIGEYTTEELILLDRVSKNPRKTRDALLNMHQRRIRELSEEIRTLFYLGKDTGVSVEFYKKYGQFPEDVARKLEEVQEQLQDRMLQLKRLAL